MAEDSPVQGLCEETTCSICLEYFRDPVIIDCGHIFCQACLTEYCGKFGTDASCPHCRETVQQKNFRPNLQLASIVEIAKKFSLHRLKGAETSGPVCERHQEPLKLFCQDDQTPICVVCDKAKEHRGHTVIPKEEAFEEYKVKSQAYLEFLKEEREEIWSSQQSLEAEGQTLLEQTERERQKIMAEFKQMHQFLEAQERHLLAKLRDLDDHIKDKRNAHIDKLSAEISAVDLLIKEMEEKQKQPANEFLQGLGNILQRCNKEKFVNPGGFPLELKQQIENVSKTHPFLETTMNEFKEAVLAGPEAEKAKFTVSGTCTIPTLILSANYSPNLCSFATGQQYPSWSNLYQNLSQFSCWSYVMGAERINSGTCSWDEYVQFQVTLLGEGENACMMEKMLVHGVCAGMFMAASPKHGFSGSLAAGSM
ncbi:PREDICTED: zinc finger protein RFP-like [Gekko japonicus]|uniref:Zinc finger protein RFP-like n=1 Tax=Gekko japonicus TaxID=146911 RepID=A0ABM1KZG5_GEKJA|nr:PREDICTED: zinc finger protein RFP-like [Gekko japonicus]